MTPTTRLRHIPIGQTVVLRGDPKEYIVHSVRPDGYIDLYYRERLAVTASAWHELESVK